MSRSVRMSEGSFDKMQACLNQARTTPADKSAKEYYDACIEWHRGLTPVQQRIVLDVLEAHSKKLPKAAEKLASLLPAAPVHEDR